MALIILLNSILPSTLKAISILNNVNYLQKSYTTYARSHVVSTISSVSIAHALSTDTDVPNGIEQPPFISGGILREPLGQRLDSTSESLKPQPDVTSFRKFHQFRIRFVRSRSTVYQRDVYLKGKWRI